MSKELLNELSYDIAAVAANVGAFIFTSGTENEKVLCFVGCAEDCLEEARRYIEEAAEAIES